MIDRIIEFSGRNRFIVLLLVFAGATMGLWAVARTPIDATPDLSDTQVIVYTTWMGRSPDLVEDQITYPIVTALVSAPRVTSVRGFSDFGFSYVYVIFEDGTDMYWARSRVLEYMAQLTGRLPSGVAPQIGPDATSVGWVFQYALVDETGRHDLAALRSFQDWYLRYWLLSVPGVAEVASVGGFVRQYQVSLDPDRLRAYGLSLPDIVERIRMNNLDVGGRVVEMSGAEYMVRGRGYIRSVADLEQIALAATPQGTPVLLRDVGGVRLGPDMRRGVADLDGDGEVVGGIVIMRFGQDTSTVIAAVKAKLEEVAPSLPEGVSIVTTYDRSGLIEESIATATRSLTEELILMAGLLLVFLLHVSSAVIAVVALPLAILIALVPVYYLGVGLNIMSLGGIIVAVADMVDASIIIVDNAHKRLEGWERNGRVGSRQRVLIDAVKEVGPAIFASLLVIAVSFMPIFMLEAQEGRLFSPLAVTKTLAITASALLAITLMPALLVSFMRGRIIPEHRHPVNRALQWLYAPVLRLALRGRVVVALLAVAAMATVIPAYQRLGSEFMPPLYEGSILYMPTTMPGISVTEASMLLQQMDRRLAAFPEVERVFGKAGRAETSTDPAPFSMMEVTVTLKPRAAWRPGVTFESLVQEMDGALQFPGVTNAWTMPIQARLDMLTTGVRTPVGIKIFGSDLAEIERIGTEIEEVALTVAGTRSAYAERVAGGYFLDFDIDRSQIARYGLSVMDVGMAIESAIGGESIDTTIEGRERYPINVRYLPELRDTPERMERVLVAGMQGAQIPLAQLGTLRTVSGPPMIRNENGMLAGYVFVDMTDRDIGSYVTDLRQAVADRVTLPSGYTLAWSGQYEFMERVRERLGVFVPLALFIIFLLFYFTFRSIVETLMVMLGVPLSIVGGIWLLVALDYNMSIAVWVGFIALAGAAAEMCAVMLAYLDAAYRERIAAGRPRTLDDLIDTVHATAVERIRPMALIGLTNILAMFPVMWSVGTGADVMKRVAAPMVGGVTSALLLTLVVIPALYVMWRWHAEVNAGEAGPQTS